MAFQLLILPFRRWWGRGRRVAENVSKSGLWRCVRPIRVLLCGDCGGAWRSDGFENDLADSKNVRTLHHESIGYAVSIAEEK